MGIDQESLLQWFSAYAYEPNIVYAAVILLLFASSFGLPVPEEVTLISAGLLVYMAMHPETFEPPYEGAQPVQLYPLMAVTFFAVFLSDLLVFFIGRFGGYRLKSNRRLQKYVTSGAFLKVEQWTLRHGAWMSGVFRFTPGLRFPGHMACGMMGVPVWKFILVDGTAALLSVPTQIWLIATYGDYILAHIKQFKIVLLILLVTTLALYFGRNLPMVQRFFKSSKAQP